LGERKKMDTPKLPADWAKRAGKRAQGNSEAGGAGGGGGLVREGELDLYAPGGEKKVGAGRSAV